MWLEQGVPLTMAPRFPELGRTEVQFPAPDLRNGTFLSKRKH